MFNKSIGIAFGSLMLATSLHAQTHYFSFKVHSSGAALYACNAGIRTQLNNCDTCYKIDARGNTTPTTRPQGCGPTDLTCGQEVVCAHRGENTGENLVNYFTATAGTINNGNVSNTSLIKRVAGASYSMVSPENQSFVTKVGDDLEFKLTSELYSAQYFVDICFQGPGIDTQKDNQALNYNIKAVAGTKDLITPVADRYVTRAGLKTKAYIICDYKTTSTQSSNTANFIVDSNGRPTNASWVSDEIDLTSDRHTLKEIMGVVNPKFCKVRYVFTETKGLECKNGKDAFRDAGLRSADICLETDFNEPQ